MFQLRDFLLYFKNFRPQVVSVTGIKGSIRKTVHITEGMQFEQNTAYIGRMSDVKYQLRFQNGCIFLLIADEDEADIPMVPKSNNLILVFSANVQEEELTRRCQSYIRMEEESEDATGQLMNLYLQDAALNDLVEATAGMIENPVMILDNSYRVISHSESISCDDPQWNRILQKGYCSYEIVSQFDQIHEMQIPEADKTKDGMMVNGCLSSPIRRLVIPIFIDGKQNGCLLAIESTSEFHETTASILKFMARLAGKASAYEALKNGREVDYEARDYLGDAVKGFDGSGERLAEYMKRSGFHRELPRMLIRFDLQKVKIKDTDVERLENVLKEKFGHVIFSVHTKYALALAELNDLTVKEAVKNLNELELFHELGLKAAVSDAFFGMEDLSGSYRQIRHAEKFQKSLYPDQLVIAYDQIRWMDVMWDQMEYGRMPLFVREQELRLYEYDRQHSTEYFKTLFVYLKNSRSLHETADELHIHKNTVSYRIAKIKEITDADLNDADVRIGFYMAYLTSGLMDAVEDGRLTLKSQDRCDT